jgi:PAS domain S-box-containing protein
MSAKSLAPQDRVLEPLNPAELGRQTSLPFATANARVDLPASESRYRVLFEQVSDGIFIVDTEEGRCVDLNPAFCHALGYAREELCGKPIGELLREEELPQFAALQQSLLLSQTARGKWSLRRKDGTWLVAELHLTSLPGRHWQAIVREISDRQRAEDALRLSEAKFSDIYAVSADAIISVDDTHRITMFNDGAKDIFGYSPEEIIGSPLEVLIPERFREIHRQHIERFSAGQQTARHMGSRSTRIYGLRKNGEEFPTDAAISKLEVEGKRLLTVSLRDISEQQRSEDEQRLLAETGEILVRAGTDYQRLLTDIASNIASTIAAWCAVDIVQAGDVRRVKIVHSDPAKAALCEALELEPIERRRANPISESFNARRPILVSYPAPGVLESLAQSEAHLKLLRAFDPGSLIVAPLIARDQPLGTLAFGSSRSARRYDARDVQQAEHLASRLALAVDNARLHEALERAVHARDEVLGIVAHDLRNPLNAIVLRAHTLRRRRGEPERRDQTAVDSIHRSAMSMHRLIGDLLDVVRLEAGQSLSILPKDVPTLGVLTEAIERRLAASPAFHRELRLDATRAPPSIWVDRSRLLQVLDNLLGNAVKFSDKTITLGSATSNGEALFWVADDGPGISADDLPRVFDRFWQASKADGRGAGLGLSIVQGIVRAHGGRIWVESKLGVGTTFYFALPMSPAT